MALVKCKECKNEVSTDAKVCPHCGAKNPAVPKWVPVVGFLVVAVIAIAIFGEGNKDKKSDVTEQEPVVEVAQKEETNTREPKKSLGIKPEEFRKNYNKLASKKLAIQKLKIEKGEVNDVFTFAPNESIYLLGTINKNTGEIKELLIHLAGENNGIDSLVIILSAFNAINNSVPKEESSKAITDMITEASNGIDSGVTVKRVVGDFRYQAVATKVTGLMLTISAN